MTMTTSEIRQLGDGSPNGLRLGSTTDVNGAPFKVGAFGATPVVQFAAGATPNTATGAPTGATGAVTSGTAYTGATGTTAYGVGDIVQALKQYGLLAL